MLSLELSDKCILMYPNRRASEVYGNGSENAETSERLSGRAAVATEQQIWAQLLSAWIWIMDQNSQWIIELSIMEEENQINEKTEYGKNIYVHIEMCKWPTYTYNMHCYKVADEKC